MVISFAVISQAARQKLSLIFHIYAKGSKRTVPLLPFNWVGASPHIPAKLTPAFSSQRRVLSQPLSYLKARIFR
jgi:hypothetical protein